MPELKYIELTPREALLALVTSVFISVIAGALYGATSATRQHSTELADCEARTAAACVIVVVPVFPRTQQNGSSGENPHVP